MKQKRISLIILLLGIILSTVNANNEDYRFISYYTRDGLPHNYINSIYQDSRGYLWIGTRNGIARFDGHEFVSYNDETRNDCQVPGHVMNVFESTDSTIWITGATNEIYSYDKNHNRFVYYADNINLAYPDDYGNLWVILDNSLYKLPIKAFENINSSNTSDKLSLICKEKNNKYLILKNVSYSSLSKTTGGQIQRYSLEGYINEDLIVNHLYIDFNGEMWLSTYKNGLLKFNIKNESLMQVGSNTDPTKGIASDIVYSVSHFSKDELWIGTMNGLTIYTPSNNSFNHYISDINNPESISDNVVTNFYKDVCGNFWVGTRFGLNRLSKKEIKLYNHIEGEESLINNNVHAFYEEEENCIWIATSKGIDRFNRENEYFRHFPLKVDNPNWINASTICITGNEDGDLWFGTWRGGLFFYDRETDKFRQFYHNPDDKTSVSNNNIMSICIDSNQDLWIGTWKEGESSGLDLYRKESDSFIHYRPDKSSNTSLSDGMVSCIYEDSFNNLWIGTLNGLNHLTDKDKGIFRQFKERENDSSLSNNKVVCIYEGITNGLWIGTEYGLNRFNYKDSTFTVFFKEDGLPSNHIMSIQEDDEGKLWISTNNGIAKLSFNKEGKIEKIKTLDRNDGLQDNEFLDRSGYKCSNGSLLFGGTNGFNLIKPDKITIDTNAPYCLITSLWIDDEEVKTRQSYFGKTVLTKSIYETPQIELSYKQKSFSIGFTAIHFASPMQNKYEYMLEGYDKDWKDADASTRKATYTNLNKGSYTFKVKAANSDGIWCDKAKELEIFIIPPFWQTIFFKILLALVFIGIILMILEIRIYIVRKQKRLLQEKVRIRTENMLKQNLLLGKQKTEIESQARKITRMNDLLKQHNIKLSKNLKSVSEARVMQKILDFSEFRKIFPNQDSCYRHLEDIKWKDGYKCRKCGNKKFRTDESYKRRCSNCQYVESVTSNTIFHHLRFPIDKAFYILIRTSSGKPVNISQLSKTLNLRMKTCWNFHNKVKEMIAARPKIKKGNWEEFITNNH